MAAVHMMSTGTPPVAEVVSALSQALDLGSGSFRGHSVRTCMVGMRIAQELRIPESEQSSLYFALLLKDAGCSNATRTDGGAALARLIGLPEETAVAIAARDEHWNGRGRPNGLQGHQIPVDSRIILLAQTLDLALNAFGPEGAMSFVAAKSGKWFDPDAVKAARSLAARSRLWIDLFAHDRQRLVLEMEPRPAAMGAGHVTFDAICQAFAIIVDAKSPFTYHHSEGVANTAAAMARILGLSESRISFVTHAALLHDLGKMAVPNTILQKAGRLDDDEWHAMRLHPEHTWRILRSIRGFEEMSEVAASHHERLDGTGYFRGLAGRQLSIESKILAVADIFDALAAKRPYRDALPLDEVFLTIRKNSRNAFDPVCIEALEQCDISADQSFRDIYALQKHLAATAADPETVLVP